ncbi:WzyE protein [Paraburkholderia tuberum]|uniref:WzyE protein n=1 Tax=Paraburkholderia tuberum TaxID=157910 RepID=A0A1H1KL62_9BURK|nr:WzyE family oligosaccharide polymerase [Paraburkholderia tuberum]SDR63068.1 WzyE protein [Paraburkholderia tuberum]
MDFFIFFVCTAALLFFYRQWRNHVGFVFFSITAAYVISILWVPYFAICNVVLNAGWKAPVQGWEFSLVGGTFCSAVCLASFAKVAFPFRPSSRSLAKLARFGSSAKGRVYIFVGLAVGIFAMVVLGTSKGITLSVGNYGSRFEANAGTGIFSIFSYVVVSVAVVRLACSPHRSTVLTSLMISVAYGMILFLTLGGERNYLVAAVAPVLLLSYMLRIIDGKRLLFFVFLCVVGITGLAFVRYGDRITSGVWLLVATYTRDTVFPVESLETIFHRDHLKFVGFEFFFEQFYSIIPRFMWPGKPIYLDTIAYYFTEHVYDYGKGLVIAPTGIGSLYLMGGWLYVIIGVNIVIGIFFILDYLIFNCNTLFFVSLWPTVFFFVL